MCEVNNRPPDFDFIQKSSNSNHYQIPKYFSREKWQIGQTYRTKVSHLYDPSKFWIVLKPEELDVFQIYLQKFYQENENKCYKVELIDIKKGLYCVVFSENAFYRGLIVKIPLSTSAVPLAQVFLFDFGYTTIADLNNIFYLTKNCFQVPQFAVRASLVGVYPADTSTWTLAVVNRFFELVNDTILLAIVCGVDIQRNLLQIRLGNVNSSGGVVADVGQVLVKEQLAMDKFDSKNALRVTSSLKYIPTVRNMYFFPLHEDIESAGVPLSVYVTEWLKECTPWDGLFKNYYVYNHDFNDDCEDHS